MKVHACSTSTINHFTLPFPPPPFPSLATSPSCPSFLSIFPVLLISYNTPFRSRLSSPSSSSCSPPPTFEWMGAALHSESGETWRRERWKEKKGGSSREVQGKLGQDRYFNFYKHSKILNNVHQTVAKVANRNGCGEGVTVQTWYTIHTQNTHKKGRNRRQVKDRMHTAAAKRSAKT